MKCKNFVLSLQNMQNDEQLKKKTRKIIKIVRLEIVKNASLLRKAAKLQIS